MGGRKYHPCLRWFGPSKAATRRLGNHIPVRSWSLLRGVSELYRSPTRLGLVKVLFEGEGVVAASLLQDGGEGRALDKARTSTLSFVWLLRLARCTWIHITCIVFSLRATLTVARTVIFSIVWISAHVEERLPDFGNFLGICDIKTHWPPSSQMQAKPCA